MAYGKIDETFWHDSLMRALPEQTRYFVLYLLSSPHRNRLGCFVLDPYYAAADLQWPVERVEEQLVLLAQKGRIGYDPQARVVFLKRFLKHNVLENKNVVLGALKELSTIPDTPLLRDLLNALLENKRTYYHDILEALRNHLGNRYPNGLPNGLPNGWGNRKRHLTLPYHDLDHTSPGYKTSSQPPDAGEGGNWGDVQKNKLKATVAEYLPLARRNIIRIHGGTDQPVMVGDQQVGVGLDIERYKRLASEPGADPEIVAMAIRYLPEVAGIEPPVSLALWEPADPEKRPTGRAVFNQCLDRALRALDSPPGGEPPDGIVTTPPTVG